MSNYISDRKCTVCQNRGLIIFYELKNVPVDCAAVFETRAEAENTQCGDISLGLCEKCGYICNTAFDPSLMESRGSYEDQQGFSPTFQKYAEGLVDNLIERYGLSNKLIVEIGCGKGDFLKLLCSRGPNRGIGIDPKADGTQDPKQLERISFIAQSYAVKHGKYNADLICCRHTLEHIHTPLEFVQTIRESIGSKQQTPLFFELPDVTRILAETAFWDIYYEHCAYYDPQALRGLFERSGFKVIEIKRGYNGQHLLLHAVPVEKILPEPAKVEEGIVELKNSVLSFVEKLNDRLGRWTAVLKKAAMVNKRVVIWGSGSKCVGFLSMLPNTTEIEFVVDINPNRQNLYTPKFGRKIVSPAFLKRYDPNIVIVMNPVYEDEIKQDLHRLKLHPDLMSV